jgi:hypothetical protein
MATSQVQAPNPQDIESVLGALEARSQQGRGARAAHQTVEPNGVEENASRRPSVRRQVFRTIISAAIISGMANFAWLAYSDDHTKDMVKAWLASVRAIKLKGRSDLAAKTSPKLSDQTVAVSRSAPTRAVAEAPPELMQQLHAIVNALVVLRNTVEGIASKQDQTSRDIASVQAAEQDIIQQISLLAQPRLVRDAAQKNDPKLGHSQASKPSTDAAPAQPAHRPPLAPLAQPRAAD